MEIPPQQFQQCLDTFLPQVGNYRWIWSLLAFRSRFKEGFPHRIHAIIRRITQKKPYFIAHTKEGVAFVGDSREVYSVVCAVHPDWDGPNIRNLLKMYRPKSGAYLDIGANMGLLAATMAKSLGDQVPVFAFEPSESTAKLAAATFALNRLTNVRLFQCAVGEKDETLTFYSSPGNSEWGSFHQTHVEIQFQETPVTCRSLDSLRQDGTIPKVGLIKIDVEGHEPNVIRGATEVISKDHPNLTYEYHFTVANGIGWSMTDMTELLRPLAHYTYQVQHSDGSLTEFPPPFSHELINVACYASDDPPAPTT